MSELPDKFEAVDPVSGEEFTLDSTGRTYYRVDGVGYGRHGNLRCEITRALIQYGRDLERELIEDESLERMVDESRYEAMGDL